jgi:hypothetical protein
MSLRSRVTVASSSTMTARVCLGRDAVGVDRWRHYTDTIRSRTESYTPYPTTPDPPTPYPPTPYQVEGVVRGAPFLERFRLCFGFHPVEISSCCLVWSWNLFGFTYTIALHTSKPRNDLKPVLSSSWELACTTSPSAPPGPTCTVLDDDETLFRSGQRVDDPPTSHRHRR